ncbi:MAG: HU family DNA-binding protein [Verrucomicrobia bacterium]|nr:HU family DNA-binding protein [Verrucomicrobiota bacterium]
MVLYFLQINHFQRLGRIMTTKNKISPQSLARKELIRYIVQEAMGHEEWGRKVLEIVLAGIKKSLKEGNTVRFLGFGTFSVRDVAARKGKHPITGAIFQIPAGKKLMFKASKDLKEAIKSNKT